MKYVDGVVKAYYKGNEVPFSAPQLDFSKRIEWSYRTPEWSVETINHSFQAPSDGILFISLGGNNNMQANDRQSTVSQRLLYLNGIIIGRSQLGSSGSFLNGNLDSIDLTSLIVKKGDILSIYIHGYDRWQYAAYVFVPYM